MPTEAAPAPAMPASPLTYSQGGFVKCSLCGGGGGPSAIPSRGSGDIVVPDDANERICIACSEAQIWRRVEEDERETLDGEDMDAIGLGLAINDVKLEDGRGREQGERIEIPAEIDKEGPDVPPILSVYSTSGKRPSPPPSLRRSFHPQSLPSQSARPWTSAASGASFTPKKGPVSPFSPSRTEEAERVPNPLLDLTKARVPSIGRGALYPGSIFRGTQTSGRSAYDVEVRLLDVNFTDSSLSGYLSISHLTDAHPHLTTFFTGEIIGPHNGFITGSRFGATEHDDMRHWGRFEQFRRPATRADMVRPELFFRDPLPDRNKGETRAKERDFVFLRIKERFLVPDHRVRDISGASFAGFYYAMVDLNPSSSPAIEIPPTPASPTLPKSPRIATIPISGRRPSNGPASPTIPRRMSASSEARSASRPAGRRRQSSYTKFVEEPDERSEATIRGYYFHSLNQEPFQELFLTHEPQRSSATFEFR